MCELVRAGLKRSSEGEAEELGAAMEEVYGRIAGSAFLFTKVLLESADNRENFQLWHSPLLRKAHGNDGRAAAHLVAQAWTALLHSNAMSAVQSRLAGMTWTGAPGRSGLAADPDRPSRMMAALLLRAGHGSDARARGRTVPGRLQHGQ